MGVFRDDIDHEWIFIATRCELDKLWERWIDAGPPDITWIDTLRDGRLCGADDSREKPSLCAFRSCAMTQR